MAGRGFPGMALQMRIGIRRVALRFPSVSGVSLPPLFELGLQRLISGQLRLPEVETLLENAL